MKEDERMFYFPDARSIQINVRYSSAVVILILAGHPRSDGDEDEVDDKLVSMN